MSDPETPRAQEPPSDATQHLQAGEPEDPQGTRRLERTDPALMPGTLKLAPQDDQSDQTQRVPLPAVPRWDAPAEIPMSGKSQEGASSSAPAQGMGWKMPLLMGALVVVGAASYLAFFRWQASRVSVDLAKETQPEAVPEAAKLYHDQAVAGDAHAMRMLGVMYYYGLNVPQNREKGLFWYRKAAEKGSDAARDELRKLESGS